MDLTNFGLNDEIIQNIKKLGIERSSLARVVSEHKKKYLVRSDDAELECEVIGKMMFISKDRADFPAVGDWVEIKILDDEKAQIVSILSRNSVLERKAVGEFSGKQIIAANVDYALIVQAVNRDFSINRIERYLAVCAASNIKPILVLSKVDLISGNDLIEIKKSVKERISNLLIVSVSSDPLIGQKELLDVIEKGKIYCLLGSSGVGKSTILNNLVGYDYMQTGEIGAKTNRGMHVTTHRELIVLESGVIVIDNPGMREVGISGLGSGVDVVFGDIATFSKQCKFSDCSHIIERGCAVLIALNDGIINQASYDNYLKMKKEVEYNKISMQEKKYKNKDLAKRIKLAKKFDKRN